MKLETGKEYKKGYIYIYSWFECRFFFFVRYRYRCIDVSELRVSMGKTSEKKVGLRDFVGKNTNKKNKKCSTIRLDPSLDMVFVYRTR